MQPCPLGLNNTSSWKAQTSKAALSQLGRHLKGCVCWRAGGSPLLCIFTTAMFQLSARSPDLVLQWGN